MVWYLKQFCAWPVSSYSIPAVVLLLPQLSQFFSLNFLSFSIIFSVFPQLSQFFSTFSVFRHFSQFFHNFLSFSTTFSVFQQLSQFFNNFLSFSSTFYLVTIWWPRHHRWCVSQFISPYPLNVINLSIEVFIYFTVQHPSSM